MQDKDMDELFRSKLDNLEVEPTGKVWKGIVVELDGAKRKRSLVPLMRIAAGIALFTAIGLFFLLKDTEPDNSQANNHIHGKNHIIKQLDKGETETTDEKDEDLSQAKQDAQQIAAEAVKQAQIEQTQSVKSNRNIAVINQVAYVSRTKHQGIKTAQKTEKEVSDEQQTLPAERENLAVLSANDHKIIQSVVPDESLTAIKPVMPLTDDFKTTNQVASIQLPSNKPTKAPVKKHGIRSFGDLINVVVAKVDKRQDKVIVFSDTDDDESTITGINLGFVKVKTDK
ncbi:hypothetical protein RG47T_3295 [Mucilaginibacter polytrichastri]|uniref:Uncharacterized protein n=2 Tax=Mucilaginibacter polytrichastri TaxID=1302689 RepID=A0A1Q6A1I4_9SPHI|nr:hypothetical protein RG47T_3295 [Mucilaginibacter polytrichastri]SFT25948.1 hypothetical protein SAMN04487890_12422 [Mucilaginibacter polytrichastri]